MTVDGQLVPSIYVLDDESGRRANGVVCKYGIQEFSLPRMAGYVGGIYYIHITFVSFPGKVRLILFHICFIIVYVSVCLWCIE